MKNRNSILVAILPVLACFALAPQVRGGPCVDGCFPNFNTAQGDSAFQFLAGGAGNTGVGWRALYSVGGGLFNTGVGAGALVLNTSSNNTATGAAAGLLNIGGINNTANGAGALEFNIAGNDNTAVGALALINNTASNCTAVGSQALRDNVGAQGNTAVGVQTLQKTTTGGSFNTGVGDFVMPNNVGGNTNTVVGAVAGLNLINGFFNTYVGDLVGSSAPDESSVIRIADPSSGFPMTACFIGGIVANAVNLGTFVEMDLATGQLFYFSSSARYKKDIKPMDKASQSIFALNPVTYRGKNDAKGIPQFGLIAEEVAKVNPDLVALDRDGKPEAVKYEGVNAMLLNEFLKEHKKVEQQQASISELKSEMQTMVAQLKEQAAQIQKVSAQVEMSKSAPQVVVNKP
jgi:Chaperone of endosialidase